jgi:purine-binding chemotaxis protein CheW
MNDMYLGGTGSSEDSIQMVIFRLGGEDFAVDIMHVQEIIRMPEVTQIPQSPFFVEGVVNIRGRVIVVVNLAKRLALESVVQDENSRIIIIELENNVVGMIVESVSEVLSIPVSSVGPVPDILLSNISADYLEGVGMVDGRLLILMDLKNVLDDGDKAMISSSGYADAVAT